MGEKLFTCNECKMKYREEKLAKECEEFCRKHKSCNLELIKHTVKI